MATGIAHPDWAQSAHPGTAANRTDRPQAEAPMKALRADAGSGPELSRRSAPLYGPPSLGAIPGVPPAIGPDYIRGLTKRWALRQLAQLLAQVSGLFWHRLEVVL